MQLIGITGGTCSGKTTLLTKLAAKHRNDIYTVSFDEYFIGSDLYNIDEITNFEDPALYNFDQFVTDLTLLKQGESLTIRANSRESSEMGIKQKIVANKPIVIVEGWLLFYNPKARELFDTKVYLDLPDDEIIARRYARSNGSKHWDSQDYIKNKIIPGQRMYVEPQKAYADIVLDGSQPREVLVERISELLQQL
jgi:uridine kinase